MKMKKMLSLILATCLVFATFGTVTVFADDKVATIGEASYATFQAALDAAYEMTGDVTITLLPGTIEGNYFLNQVAGLNLTIRAEERGTVTIKGGFTVDGLGNAGGTETLKIENLKFDFSDLAKDAEASGIYAAAYSDTSNPYKSQVGHKYPHNVTVSACDFVGNGSDGKVVVLQNPSGSTGFNYTLENCTATDVHSLVQANGSFQGLTISGNKVTNAGRGLNLVQSTAVTVSDNEFSVEKYGVRIGAGSGDSIVANYEITDNKIETSSNDADDAAIVLRKTSAGATVTIEENAIVVTGSAPAIAFDKVSSNDVTVDAGLNYWGGASPKVSGGTVSVDAYYTDEDMVSTKEAAALEIYTVEDLKAFGAAVNGGKNFHGKTVELMNDLDMAGVTDWEPIGVGAGDKRFYGTFDGQGNTIYNFRSVKDISYGHGFFGDINGGAVIKNITFDNAYVARYNTADDVYSGNVYGIVCGYAYGNVTFENVTVKNSKVLGFGKVGAILGMAADPGASTTKVINCLVENTTVAGAYDCGAFVGLLQNNIDLAGSRTSGVTWSSAPGYNYVEVNKVAGDGTEVEGIYWAYSPTFHFAGWGSMYNDIDEVTVDGITYEIIVNAQAKISAASTMSLRAATVGDVYYSTLQEAIAAVQDGETVTLLKDVTVNDGANALNITRGVSFTLNLGGHTLTANTSNGAIRININNDDVTAPVEINITNGTVTAGSSAYCALLAAGKDSTNTLTVNLEDVNLNGANPDGSVAKIFANAIANVGAGTVITGADSYGAMEVMGTANVYDGAELYQNGTTSYNGNIIGVSGGGVANVYGGKGVSANAGLIVMTSGGTMNVYGGEWTANNGVPGTGNKAVLISQNNRNEFPSAPASVLNVYGGTFVGGYDCAGYAANSTAKLAISGGKFSESPAAYLAEGAETLDVVDTDGYFYVGEKTADKVTVVFSETATPGLYDIKLESEEYDIYELVSAELTFKNASKTNGGADMQYEASGISRVTSAEENFGIDNAEDERTFNFRLVNHEDISARLTGKSLTIGQIKFIGESDNGINLTVTKGKAAATKRGTHDEDWYILTDDDVDNDTLLKGAGISGGKVVEARRDVVVNVAYIHDLAGDYWQDNKMTVSLKDAFGNEFDAQDISDGLATFTGVQLGRITVTLKGEGFRTYSYTTVMEEAASPLVLSFWNDVKRERAEAIEEGKGTMLHNFLVGDIVMDYMVDEYDLAAVTSYYGMYALTDADKYMKYDLNRDGNIDIIDVAYVLHTLNN